MCVLERMKVKVFQRDKHRMNEVERGKEVKEGEKRE